jgi:O-acetyl-ADP-ribose deacetylase (regulator of RNase III)
MQIEPLLCNITILRVDAIANAANEELAPGGGVCGSIHRAAGPDLAHECARAGPCSTGDAKATRGYALPVRLVILAVDRIRPAVRREELEAQRSIAPRHIARCLLVAFGVDSPGPPNRRSER